MSYCRFSDGDVYMYGADGGIRCCGCRLVDEGADDPGVLEPRDALAHLADHAAAGHVFPFEVAAEILSEIADDVPANVKQRQDTRRAEDDKRVAAAFANLEDFQRCGTCALEDFDAKATVCPRCGGGDLFQYARFNPEPGGSA